MKEEKAMKKLGYEAKQSLLKDVESPNVKKIRTEYVRNKVKGKSFDDYKFRRYIEDLITIERWVLAGGSFGWAGGMSMHQGTLPKYPKEYEAIKDELKPGWRERDARRLAKERKEEEREEKKYQATRKKEDRQWKKEWLSKGGKP